MGAAESENRGINLTPMCRALNSQFLNLNNHSPLMIKEPLLLLLSFWVRNFAIFFLGLFCTVRTHPSYES